MIFNIKKLVISLVFLIPLAVFSQNQEITASAEKEIPGAAATAEPSVEKIPVVIDADEIDFQRQVGKVFAKGNVKMAYKEVELYCDEGVFDVNANIAHIN